jgi:[lysine-biosynthesis-protein LysW]--L-2-aminoadipate ligase
VLKPTTGSWGRLLARVNDRDAAEAVIEHKSTLGSVQHSVYYVQEYVEKPDRDLRVFVLGQDAVCGIVRRSPHWITNTGRGGSASVLEITPEIRDLCARAARAVARNAGALLAIDLLEAPDRGLLVSEINHTMEFRHSIAPTGVDIPRRMIEWVVDTSRHSANAIPAALHGSSSVGSSSVRSSSAPANTQTPSRSPGTTASVLEELKLGPWAAFDAHSRTEVA